MILKLLIFLCAIHFATCVWNKPTLSWHNRSMFITMRPMRGYNILNDSMGFTEKMFISNMTLEIVRDAHLKFRQISEIRKDHANFIAYHVGLVVGKIREKYRNMLDIYREAQDHRHKRQPASLPGMEKERVEHHFFFFELVRKYELHIDHLVNVLESIPEEDWEGKGGVVPKAFYEKKLPYGRRFSKLDQFGCEIEVLKEQNLKRDMRQKFLLKKMGKPVNISTSQKRFINKWPVMKTWDDYFSKMY